MLRKVLITAALTTAFVAPAFAATTYYIEQSAKTHKCYVTAHKPNGKTLTQVGTDTYTTKSAALKAMKSAAACKA